MVASNCRHISTTVQMAAWPGGVPSGAAAGAWQAASVIWGRRSEVSPLDLGLRAGPTGMRARMAFLAASVRDLGRRLSGAGLALARVVAKSCPLASTSGSVRGSYCCGPTVGRRGALWSGRVSVTSERAGKRSWRWAHAVGVSSTVDQEGAINGARCRITSASKAERRWSKDGQSKKV